MGAHLLRISLGVLAISLCAMAAGAMAAFVPMPHGLSGRDFRLPGGVMAGLICVVVTVLRGPLRWPAIDLLASLVSAEAIALWVIAIFSGLTGMHLFDPFNLRWLAMVSLFIAPPLLAGVLIGGFVSTNRTR